ncbi:hypothetical protein HG430_003005 [Candidatus Gracilibacteria bacterium]|nr:hypothetical protein [Candidatus Gracilibacteria bacterium]
MSMKHIVTINITNCNFEEISRLQEIFSGPFRSLNIETKQEDTFLVVTEEEV